MNRRAAVWIIVSVGGLLLLLACIAVLPRYIVALDLSDRSASIGELLQATNSTRTTLVQAFAGLFLLSGAYVTWKQYQNSRETSQEELRLSREGRVTERITAAVEQLSSNEAAVRVGAVYTLGRLADESPSDRESIDQILATYIRERGRIKDPIADHVERMSIRLPEIQAALTVLSRASRFGHPVHYVSLDLTATDLRRAELANANLFRARLVDCLFARTALQRADLRSADLRRANLAGANLAAARADVLTWWPEGFDPVAAGVHIESSLAGADLRGADLRTSTVLESTDLRGARANEYTLWPAGFDWQRAGVIKVNGMPDHQ
jgi:hypothetical protein